MVIFSLCYLKAYAGDISSEFTEIIGPSTFVEFVESYVPNAHTFELLKYFQDISGGDPTWDVVKDFSIFKSKGFLFQIIKENQNWDIEYEALIKTPTGEFSRKSDFRMSNPCIVNDELYFMEGEIRRLNSDSDFEVLVNDFNAYELGDWNNELVMVGNNHLSIGTYNNRIQLNVLRDQVDASLGYRPKMKIDHKGHLWFSGYNSTSPHAIEVIIDAENLEDFQEMEIEFTLENYDIKSDTTEVTEQGETFKLIRHTVSSGGIAKPNEVIDIDGDVYISTNLGFLRRQKEGLVPVIETENNRIGYFLYKNEGPLNQLYPFNTLSLIPTSNGFDMEELTDESDKSLILGEDMADKLLGVSDGRAFYLENYFDGSFYDRKSLFVWGNQELGTVKQLKRIYSNTTDEFIAYEESNLTIDYGGSQYDLVQTISSDQAPAVSDGIGGWTPLLNDAAIIRDSLILYQNSFLQVPIYYDEVAGNIKQMWDYPYLRSFSVSKYKDEPVYFLKLLNEFSIGHIENLTKYSLDAFEIYNPSKLEVTDDNHIWFMGNGCPTICELIREKDQEASSTLKSYCSIRNIEIGMVQLLSDSTEATIQLNFEDTMNGAGFYNVYLDQVFVKEFSNNNSFELTLSSLDGAEQSFEIHVQNQNDLLCKTSTTIELFAPILDQDGDGFGEDVDCDDFNADLNPAAIEIPDNNIDEDCDGILGITDVDMDGFGINEDCDDFNPEIYPGSFEIPDNDVDEDCNGVLGVTDTDMDGFGIEVDCDDNNPDIYPGAEEIPENGIDEDCDGDDLTSTFEIDGIEVSVFPNPAVDELWIKSESELSIQFTVLSLGGKDLRTGTLENSTIESIDLQSLPDGVYYLKLNLKGSPNNIVMNKIVVAR